MNPPFTRREILKLAGAAAVSTVAPGCNSDSAAVTLPSAAESGIDHIVLVMMENRSFDHYLGWVPGADGRQENLVFPDRAGQMQTTYPMVTGHVSPWQGCGSADPAHGYDSGRTHLNNGRLDGWLLTDPTQLGDTFPIAYYRRQDLPFYDGAVADWTVCDHYYSGILAGTWPNRFYMHAGDNDFLDADGIEKQSQLTGTLWDALAAKGIEGRYYFGNLPFVGLFGAKYLPISRPLETFFIDCALGNLPAVSYVDPIFESGAPNGLSNDDHPISDIRGGQFLLNRIYDAVRQGPQWSRTLIIINYDEWGGFFDHLVPPILPPSDVDRSVTGNDGRLGFRVPCMLIGPRAKRGHVYHGLLEPNAILNFFSWRFDLPPIGSRSRHSGNMAYALDWKNPPNTASRAYSVPAGIFGYPCDLPTEVGVPGIPPIVIPGGVGLSLGSSQTSASASTAESDHVRQMRGLYEKAKALGFWTGPVVFPD